MCDRRAGQAPCGGQLGLTGIIAEIHIFDAERADGSGAPLPTYTVRHHKSEYDGRGAACEASTTFAGKKVGGRFEVAGRSAVPQEMQAEELVRIGPGPHGPPA